ncbi:hypothetical protein MLD38_039928 [Melastoma candidum]|uniref:Uncharacterized protein n=1 Tax=Melastoma candidum TaxID=119954 RepID=A0ACB9L3Q6_9MYRT|nr:hypothetical protein MLD38_039928 [Melastoma candidum]
MALHTCDAKFQFGYGSNCCDGRGMFKRDFLAGAGSGCVFGGESSLASRSQILDNERGELLKAPAGSRSTRKRGVSEEKALAALRSHSEAERRRRERINSHLATLRELVPCTDKMDKATLLAEVICEVKELKRKSAEATRGLLIPTDTDEVTVSVEPCEEALGNGCVHFKATICCEHHPQLFSDLVKGLEQATMRQKILFLKAEVSTLENRLKNAFVFGSCGEELRRDANAQRALAGAIHRALSSVAAKASAPPEYSPTTTVPSKKRRHSLFDSSSTSS